MSWNYTDTTGREIIRDGEAVDSLQCRADEIAGADTAEDANRAPRCPVCGGLNPGDITHTRC